MCVLGSVLDQNVPSGFVLSLRHTLESFFLLHSYSHVHKNTAEGIHIYTHCTSTDDFWCFEFNQNFSDQHKYKDRKSLYVFKICMCKHPGSCWVHLCCLLYLFVSLLLSKLFTYLIKWAEKHIHRPVKRVFLCPWCDPTCRWKGETQALSINHWIVSHPPP